MKRHQALHRLAEDPDSFSGIVTRCRATKKHLGSTFEHLRAPAAGFCERYC